jgi:hypothetical protein
LIYIRRNVINKGPAYLEKKSSAPFFNYDNTDSGIELVW